MPPLAAPGTLAEQLFQLTQQRHKLPCPSSPGLLASAPTVPSALSAPSHVQSQEAYEDKREADCYPKQQYFAGQGCQNFVAHSRTPAINVIGASTQGTLLRLLR
jgi:hypothetical protein